MFLALFAYRNVLNVSSKLTAAGLSVAIMIVFELPPRLSFRSLGGGVGGGGNKLPRDVEKEGGTMLEQSHGREQRLVCRLWRTCPVPPMP